MVRERRGIVFTFAATISVEGDKVHYNCSLIKCTTNPTNGVAEAGAFPT